MYITYGIESVMTTITFNSGNHIIMIWITCHNKCFEWYFVNLENQEIILPYQWWLWLLATVCPMICKHLLYH